MASKTVPSGNERHSYRPTRHRGFSYRLRADGSKSFVGYIPGRGRVALQATSEREALAEWNELRGRAARGIVIAPANVKFESEAEEWYESTRRLRPWTRKQSRALLDGRYLPRYRNWKIGAVAQTRVIAAEIEQMEKEGLSPSTIRNYLAPLVGTLQHAASKGLIPANPYHSLTRNQKPEPRTREMPYEWSEAAITALFDSAAYLAKQPAARRDYTLVLQTAVNTGARLGEILGLQWRDFDSDAATLRIERQWTRMGEYAPPKTKAGVRVVPLTPEMVTLLRKHRLASKYSQDTDPIFASHNGTPLAHRNVQRRGFEPARDLAELPSSVTFHDLRHAFASIAAHRGVPVGIVSKIMGHANVGITLSVYTHLFNPDEAHEAFRVAMAGSMP